MVAAANCTTTETSMAQGNLSLSIFVFRQYNMKGQAKIIKIYAMPTVVKILLLRIGNDCDI